MGARTALVLGATGGIGGETAAALRRHDWNVVAMARDPAKRGRGDPKRLEGIKWLRGDAMVAADVRRSAEGADVIVHAVNPPGYRDWDRLVLPMIDNTIAAAKAIGARIILPGTVYNYGPDAFPNLREDSTQHPTTKKGEIRVELERRLEEASRQDAAALIVRYGDFFGPAPGGNWFDMLVKPGKRAQAITYPGRRGVGHCWAYLPDAGEAIALLLDRADELESFARFHFSGVWDADGTQMTSAIAEMLGRPDIKIKSLPWPLLRALGLVNETLREAWLMRYLWQQPVRLDNSKLVAFLGAEPHTPLTEAVGTTLRAMGTS